MTTTYRQKRMLCERYGSTGQPTCRANSLATTMLSIAYTAPAFPGWADAEIDVLQLCESCAKWIAEDAPKHGYRIVYMEKLT